MRIDRTLAVAALTCIAACAGRNALPAVAPGAPAPEAAVARSNGEGLILHPQSSASLDVLVDVASGGADFTRAFPARRLHRPAQPFGSRPQTISKLELDGVVYPSYASATAVTNKIDVPAPKGPVKKVTIAFGSLPAANNEFVDVTIYAVAADGSRWYLGDLAALADVKAKTSELSLTLTSTLAFQAGMALVEDGAVTAADLATTPSYAAEMHKRIAKDHLKPDPSTRLLGSQALQHFLAVEAPRHARTLTIATSAGASVVSIVNDVRDEHENTLVANELEFPVEPDLRLTRPAGAPCDGYTRVKAPTAKNRPAYDYCASIFPASSVPLVLPVYGGPLVVGDGNASVPYTGIFQDVEGRNPGTKTLQLGAMTPAQTTMTTNDPFNWAFQSFSPLSGTTVRDDFPEMEVLTNPDVGGWYFYAYNSPLQWSVPNNYWNPPHPPLEIDTWNPWHVPASTFRFCTGWRTCHTIGAPGAFDPNPPFWDPGTDLAYFHWQASGGSAIAVAGESCRGYKLTLAGNTATMTTTVPTWMHAGQSLFFYFDPTPCGSTPTGSIAVTVTATDGTKYVSYSSVGTSYTQVTMSTMLFPIVQVKSITFSIETQVPTATLDLDGIGNDWIEPSS